MVDEESLKEFLENIEFWKRKGLSSKKQCRLLKKVLLLLAREFAKKEKVTYFDFLRAVERIALKSKSIEEALYMSSIFVIFFPKLFFATSNLIKFLRPDVPLEIPDQNRKLKKFIEKNKLFLKLEAVDIVKDVIREGEGDYFLVERVISKSESKESKSILEATLLYFISITYFGWYTIAAKRGIDELVILLELSDEFLYFLQRRPKEIIKGIVKELYKIQKSSALSLAFLAFFYFLI